ncbi:MAG TPA: sulfotransferase [Anaerolineales bacterium]|nr:sulfotransferase [Anaerolineales bacterium]
MKASLQRLWVSFLNSDGFRRFAKRGSGSFLFKSSAYRSFLMARKYITSYYRSRRYSASFRDVKTYCTFIGHMKSGGSMIGSLLDAHPNVILADEAGPLRYVQAGFKREQIFYILLRASQREFMKGRVTARRLTAYSWLVPGQWQGRFKSLRVIGDSTTGASTQLLARTPGLFEKLCDVMEPVDLKFIHVIRNPYDPISVMMVRGKRSFEDACEHYFRSCEMLSGLHKRLDTSNILPVKYEDFVNHPEKKLAEICAFLGLSAMPEYLAACASILHESPERSRNMVKWKPEWIDQVKTRMAQYDFLAGYSFEEENVNAHILS